MKNPFKKKLLIAALVPAFGLPLALPSVAQTGTAQQGQTAQGQQAGQPARAQQQGQAQRQQQQQQVRDMRASELIGATVRDQQNQNIGDVQDLIVDTQSGRVDYAILAFGGFLGFGEKLFAYPMDRFQAAGQDNNELRLNVTEQQLQDAPGFDRSNWPTFGAGGYRGEVDRHFGRTVAGGGNLVRMSQLLDQEVHDRAGNNIGDIEDIVVSVTDGRVRYVVLDPDNDLNMGDRLVLLPMNAIQARAGEPPQQRGTGARTTGGATGGDDQQGAAGAGQGQQQDQWYQGQDNRPGQPQDQTMATGGASGQGAAGTTTGQPRAQGQQAQAQQGQRGQQQAQRNGQGGGLFGGDGREMHLVLNVNREQLRNARTFEQNQWPNLNDPAFRRDMDRYVAGFPGGGQQRTTGEGAAGTGAAGADDDQATGAGAQGGAAAGQDQHTGQQQGQEAEEGQPRAGQAGQAN